MKIGIYKISNIATDDYYVGSTKRLDIRQGEHFLAAAAGRHHSIIFQRAYDKYGKDNFSFEIIELCSEESLLEREQHYIDILQPKYNIAKTAGIPNPPPNKPILRICMVSGDEKIYNVRDDAAAEGFNEGEITACCLGRAGSHSGYYWQFLEEDADVFVNKSRTKAVESINIKTKEKKTYPSMTAATKDGFSLSGISACILFKQKTHKGHYWNLANHQQKDLKQKVKDTIINPTIEGEIIRINPTNKNTKTYSSIDEVVFDGFNKTHVKECVLGKRNFHGNYIWRNASHKTLDLDKIDIRTFNKAIKRTDPKTGEEKIYPYLNAVKQDGFSTGNVHMCCNGQRGSHKGYIWQYLNESNEFKSSIKQIIRIDPQTNEQKIYKNKAETAKDGFSPAKVGACCLGRRLSHKGYVWKEFIS